MHTKFDVHSCNVPDASYCDAGPPNVLPATNCCSHLPRYLQDRLNADIEHKAQLKQRVEQQLQEVCCQSWCPDIHSPRWQGAATALATTNSMTAQVSAPHPAVWMPTLTPAALHSWLAIHHCAQRLCSHRPALHHTWCCHLLH